MVSDYPTSAFRQRCGYPQAELFTFDKEGKLVYLVTITRGDQLRQEIEGK